MPSQTGRVMVNRLSTLVDITCCHCSRLMRWNSGVAGDAGIVDQDLDRAELGLDLGDAGLAGLGVGDTSHL